MEENTLPRQNNRKIRMIRTFKAKKEMDGDYGREYEEI